MRVRNRIPLASRCMWGRIRELESLHRMELSRMSRLLVVTCVLLSTLLIGCAAAPPESESEAAPAEGGMMGAGGIDPLAGAIAAAANASMTLGSAASQARGVKVEQVLAPMDGWLVVRSATPPGSVLGKTRLSKGLSRNVPVRLDAADGTDVRIALHVDQGTRGVFEFDPKQPTTTLDKPVVVGGKAIEAPVVLRDYGVEAGANNVLILVEDQSVQNGTLTLNYLLLPTPAWISVNVAENGLPGKQVGLVMRPAGEYQQVIMPVEGAGPGPLLVTVLADRGRRGVFEFSTEDPLGSVDQPFKSAGVVVSHVIEAK